MDKLLFHTFFILLTFLSCFLIKGIISGAESYAALPLYAAMRSAYILARPTSLSPGQLPVSGRADHLPFSPAACPPAAIGGLDLVRSFTGILDRYSVFAGGRI